MTDYAEKLKAAFMTLLANYQSDFNDATGYDTDNDYCARCCPFGKRDCPVHDDDDTAEDKCREEIFNRYMEKTS